MSLLWMEYDSEFQHLADAVLPCDVAKDPTYYSRLSQRTRSIITRDTRLNIDFLYTAYLLDDDKIMSEYSRWLFHLLAPIFKNRTPDETAEYILNHFDSIRQAVLTEISADKQERLLRLIECGKTAVREETDQPSVPHFHTSPYEKEVKEYLDSLLRKDTRKAMYLVQQFTDQGIPLDDLYVEILSECMNRIGELWHTSRITVDTEHYCTAVTQTAMTQLYPLLFSHEKKNHRILCACPGTELHEMGARMVADIFENDGWDSFYLGAAVPENAMLESIRDIQPDLIALSVTMPQHLITCQEMIDAIRREFPAIRIAVGGRAFRST